MKEIDIKHIIVNMGHLVENLGDKELGTQIVLNADMLTDYFEFKPNLRTITWESIHAKILGELDK